MFFCPECDFQSEAAGRCPQCVVALLSEKQLPSEDIPEGEENGNTSKDKEITP